MQKMEVPKFTPLQNIESKRQESEGMAKEQLAEYLDRLVNEFNRTEYISNDPISVPHSFTLKQDIEISGLFASIFSWGVRKTIIKKTQELMALMDNSPYDFIRTHQETDLKSLLNFKHRTFNGTDLLYFIDFLKRHYNSFDSLEDGFLQEGTFKSMEKSLIDFHNYFIDSAYFPKRTAKHLSTPEKNSACKRLTMYLRWMVRPDSEGVDFGLWKKIPLEALVCPCDVHVLRTAWTLGLLKEEKSDWKTATLLTKKLAEFCPEDPVKYDFALYNLGVLWKKGSVELR